MRGLLAVLVALGLALAEGWVLPFDSPYGTSEAYAVAEALDARDPVFAGLFLPDPPWPRGWRLTLPRLASPGGVRMVAEATGADWVLAAWRDGDGLYHSHLFFAGRTYRGLVGSPEAVALWAAGVMGRPLGEVRVRRELEPVLSLAFGDPVHAAGVAREAGEEALAERLSRYAQVLAGAGWDELPPELAAFWRGFHHPKEMPDEGMGLVWRVFAARGEGAELERLLGSPLMLHQTAALLILRDREDPRWRELARRLAGSYPDYAWGQHMRSVAAFEEDRPQEAREALLAAVRLEPENSLYWTNLGWAHYLLGELSRAWLASQHAVELEDNATARYNLGLICAIWRAHDRAGRHYWRATALDSNWEIFLALEDLRGALGDHPWLAYWIGQLELYAGEVERARQTLSRFLDADPPPPLARRARGALAKTEDPWTRVRVKGVSIREEGKLMDRVGEGEPVWLLVSLEAEPFLAHRRLRVVIKGGDGKPVYQGELFDPHPPYPPGSSGYVGWVGPVPAPSPGEYRLEVLFPGARDEIELDVGESNLARLYYAAGLVPKGLSGGPLLPDEALIAENGEEVLITAALEEIRAAAPGARSVEILVTPLGEGKSVAEIMEEADEELVREFLEEALSHPELLEPNLVEGFARWVLSREMQKGAHHRAP